MKVKKTKIYAMVSCLHKEKEGQKSANFFVFAYAGMVDAAQLLDPDITVEWHGPYAWDPVPESNTIKGLTARGIDGIVVSAADETALNPAINEAIQTGIPIIAFDADAPASDRLTFVGTNNYKAGYLAGTTMAQWLQGEGEVAAFTIRHLDHLTERLEGFTAAMQTLTPKTAIHIMHNTGNIVLTATGQKNGEEYYYRRCTEVLQAHPGIRGIFVNHGEQGYGPVRAIADLHLQGKVHLLTFDFDEHTIKLVTQGKIRSTVGQDPYVMGYVSMILAYHARHTGEMPARQDRSWQIRALTEFLGIQTGIPKQLTDKLTTVLAGFKQSVDTTFETEAEILGKNKLLELLASYFGDMRDSISDKISVLSVEIEERKQAQEALQEHTTALKRTNALLQQEITERTKAEHTLRVSEQQYRLLAESVKEGIVIVQDEKLLFANGVFTAMSGYSLEQVMMTAPVNLFPDFAREITRMTPQWQTEMVTADGQILWTEIEQAEIVWNSQPAILLTIRNITERKHREQRLEEERVRLQQENLGLKSTIKERYRFGALVGKSPAMQRVYELIVSAATSDVNVLLVGESGTGKELIARALHQVSSRRKQTFVPVNCASIPETLFEREFFGHRKGAFTGADRDKPGLFDRADQGTLFLDEVTELNPGTQAKLLRVLQDGEYTPLGSPTPKQADVLIIAATNRDCREEIEQGRLRKDFFYRIGVIEIAVPPLRERKDDLPLLIDHILEQYRQKQVEIHESVPEDLPTELVMLPGELVRAFYAYDWPGNVRELQNVLQRYLATRDMRTLLSHLAIPEAVRSVLPQPSAPPQVTLPEAVKAFEKQMIAEMLARNLHRTRRTAEMLGIPLTTLYYKMKSYDL